MTTKIICLLMLVVFLFWSIDGISHSGRTDKNGGHTEKKTGQYHFHNKPKQSKGESYYPSGKNPFTTSSPKQELSKQELYEQKLSEQEVSDILYNKEPSKEFDKKFDELMKTRRNEYIRSSFLNLIFPILIGVGVGVLVLYVVG